MLKIAIVEDDPIIREELALLLENEGYQAVAVTNFNNISQQIREAAPDLILLDLGLPGRDGISLCAEIRKTSRTPIIFVTSRDSAADELRALSLGTTTLPSPTTSRFCWPGFVPSCAGREERRSLTFWRRANWPSTWPEEQPQRGTSRWS